MDELESKTNARRAQGGLGLLSHTISVQNLQKSIPLIPREEREEEERDRKRRAVPGGSGGVVLSVAGAQREERGKGFLTH